VEKSMARLNNKKKEDLIITGVEPLKSEEATLIPEPFQDIPCIDTTWCNIEMPTQSSYRFFEPPKDLMRWKRALALAASGDQVLLKRIVKTFTHSSDFLDGDRQFRKIHSIIDIFVDNEGGFQYLLPPSSKNPLWRSRRRLDSEDDEVGGELLIAIICHAFNAGLRP
jgi:hypothetical protein